MLYLQICPYRPPSVTDCQPGVFVKFGKEAFTICLATATHENRLSDGRTVPKDVNEFLRLLSILSGSALVQLGISCYSSGNRL